MQHKHIFILRKEKKTVERREKLFNSGGKKEAKKKGKNLYRRKKLWRMSKNLKK
jgi:hypothetical protein